MHGMFRSASASFTQFRKKVALVMFYLSLIFHFSDIAEVEPFFLHEFANRIHETRSNYKVS